MKHSCKNPNETMDMKHKEILFTGISYLYSVTLGRVPMEQAQPSSWIVCKGCLCSLPLGAVSLAAFLLSRQQTQKTGLVRESDSDL